MFYNSFSSHPLISTMDYTLTPSIIKTPIFLIIIFLTQFQLTNAQYTKNPTSSNFQPSLFVVIGVLSFMFSLTCALLIYAKLCHRHRGRSAVHSLGRDENRPEEGMFGTNTRFSGLDKRVVESLPFFKFSSLKGSKQGLQCAVCLAEFEDSEILRLLPKCKHGFHLECIDQWLDKHSTCPLCRQNVSAHDMENFISSNSFRFCLEDKSDDSSVHTKFEPSSSIFELFVERVGNYHHDYYDINGSCNEEEIAMCPQRDSKSRLNHKIIISDVVFKNRWSNISSSDLMFLNSEMLGVMSSDRFSWWDNKYYVTNHDHEHHCYNIMTLKDEMERKMNFEHKIDRIKRSNSHSSLKGNLDFEYSRQNSLKNNRLMRGDKRAMSEITAVSRFQDVISMNDKVRECLEEHENVNNDVNDGVNDFREDIKRRKIWFPIAKRTVQWFANREKNRNRSQQQSQNSVLNV